MTGPHLAALRPQVKSPFLDGLAPRELDEILAAARECRFLAGTVLASQGTPANSLFLLVSGRARFFVLTPDGHKIVLMWLPVGEVIGGAALQSVPSDYIVSTETVKDCTILVWDRPAIRRLAIRYPRLLDNALNIGRRVPHLLCCHACGAHLPHSAATARRHPGQSGSGHWAQGSQRHGVGRHE